MLVYEPEILRGVVNVLKSLTLLDTSREELNKLAELLKQDIKILTEKRDARFAQNLLVPLLNAELEIAVCINFFDNVAGKWISDFREVNNLPDFLHKSEEHDRL